MIDTADVQGILLSGYGDLAEARFIFFTFGEPAAARAWVKGVSGSVRSGADGPPRDGIAVQIAFTYPGLERLELSWHALNGFSREFREGIAGSDRRSRILGDVGDDAPHRWRWGGPINTELHALLLLYADNAADLEALADRHRRLAQQHDVSVAVELDSRSLPGRKEHFGFRDGISQPKLESLSSSTDPMHLVRAGEFVLGYPNERDEYTGRPLLDPAEDPAGLLEPVAEGDDLHDLGRNGTYLVIRQLSQDVHGFWSWASAAASGDPVALAAKLVGRWPGGAPLVSSERDDPEHALDNGFGYHEEDLHGVRCPIGAHVRRTNPRNSLPPKPGSDESLEINRRHRLLRRGRAYGEPLVADLDPQAMLAAGDDGAERGLHFACLNADISRQFEFVQSTWANNANFAGLKAETDPLIGDRSDGADLFTRQAEPVRERFSGLPRFVGVRGGAYLFLPGMRALGYIGSQPRSLTTRYSAPAAPAVLLRATFWSRAARAINTVLERAITITRRLTRLRNALDRLFQAPLTRLLQRLLVRRRVRRQIDADLAIAEERLVPGEEQATRQITQQMTAFLLKHYRSGVAERAGNTKTYGLLNATFEVGELADELRVGLFEAPRRYDAWVRFGGPGPLVTPDIRNNGVLSIGVKLLGVDGQTLLDDEPGSHDFSGISAPTFTTPDVVENLKLQQHIGAGIPTGYFLNPFDSHYLDMLMQALYAKAQGSPFDTSYWSCVPYLFGAGRAFKYRFAPRVPLETPVPLPAPDDYLRASIRDLLAAHGTIAFDFQVQFQECPIRMPIEDASIIWSSAETKLATLMIADQEFDTPERDQLARELTINPWHALPEHRPLGSQNRARRKIYQETSRVRQRINGEQHRVPPANPN